MEQFYAGVSSFQAANIVYAAGALPVFAVENCAYSGLNEIAVQDIDPSLPHGVLMNRIFREGELPRISQTLEALRRHLPERIYFADPAVFSLCDDTLRSRLVYRPETLMTNQEDIRFWKNTGIQGVTVSPLLTAEELYAAAEAVPGTEFVIHGHLLMSVSARKLLTSWAAQYDKELPEGRPLFLREETRSDRYPVKETAAGTMIFTDYVLESFDYIRSLASHGASAFYLDGSFLDLQDLTDALFLYRALLTGSGTEEQIKAYRSSHPECREGYYGQETVR